MNLIVLVIKKNIIRDYIKENKDFELIDYYVDNGFTDTNFDRPSFAKLCFDIVKKKINCVIVKDISKFGRDSG